MPPSCWRVARRPSGRRVKPKFSVSYVGSQVALLSTIQLNNQCDAIYLRVSYALIIIHFHGRYELICVEKISDDMFAPQCFACV